MAWFAEPLQVFYAVVVAGVDVVGVGADSVASSCVCVCLAESVCSGFALASEFGPVLWEPVSAVAGCPRHWVASVAAGVEGIVVELGGHDPPYAAISQWLTPQPDQIEPRVGVVCVVTPTR